MLSVGIRALPKVSLFMSRCYLTHMTRSTIDTHHHQTAVLCSGSLPLVMQWSSGQSSSETLCWLEAVKRLKKLRPWEETQLFGFPSSPSALRRVFFWVPAACLCLLTPSEPISPPAADSVYGAWESFAATCLAWNSSFQFFNWQRKSTWARPVDSHGHWELNEIRLYVHCWALPAWSSMQLLISNSPKCSH